MTVANREPSDTVRRDAFAPGWLFALAFTFTYAVPYLHLVDYSDLMPPPGARMAFAAALGLAGYLVGLTVARRHWPTRGRARPRIAADAWRSRFALLLLVAVAAVSLGVFVLTLRIAEMVPLLEANKEAARWAFTERLGHAVNAATRLPITAALACGLFLLVAKRPLAPSSVLAALFIALAIVTQSLLGHRGLPIFVLAPLVIAFHYLVRPIRLGLLMAAGLAAIVALGVANYLRLSTSPPQLEHLLAHSKLPAWVPPALTPAVTFVAFSPLTFNLVLATVPEREPFQLGSAFVHGAFGILPGHQATISEFVSRRLLLQPEGSPGLPPTILGGLYIDFGLAGIGLGMLLIGVASQYLHWRMFERPSLWAVFLYAYWTFNLFVALYGDLVANDLIWFIPLSIYAIHLAIERGARRFPSKPAAA